MAQAQNGNTIEAEETRKYVNMVESYHKINQFADRFEAVNTQLGVHNREAVNEEPPKKDNVEINSLTDVVDFLPGMISSLVEKLHLELSALEERLK